MKFNKIYLGLLLILTIHTSANLAEAEDKYTLKIHIEDSWADIQEKSQNREIDGLVLGGRDPSRAALYNATDIVLSTYFSVFARARLIRYRLPYFLMDNDFKKISNKNSALSTRIES